MLKKTLTYLLLIFHVTTYAQFKIVGQTEQFEEPGNGYGKFLILQNGNTVFCNVINEKLNLRIFSPNHKQIKNFYPAPEAFNHKGAFIKAIFESNNDIVLMVIRSERKTPVLTRVIIDSGNGRIKEEKELARLETERFMYKPFFIALGYVQFFHVSKDPHNNQYAVVLLRSKSKNVNDHIECIWFAEDHREITRATFTVNEEGFDFIKFIDLNVIDDQQLTIVAMGVKGGKKQSRQLMLGVLKKDQHTFKTVSLDLIKASELNIDKDVQVQSGLLKFNPTTNKLILLTTFWDNRNQGYIPLISYLNVATTHVEFTGLVLPEAAISATQKFFGEKMPFSSLPLDIHIADDGRFTVIMEEMTYTRNNDGIVDTFLKNIAVVYFDMLGGMRSSYLIPKSQSVPGENLGSYYMGRQKMESSLFLGGNQFKRAIYLDGKFGTYIMFNDVERNTENYKKGKITMIVGVQESDAYSYRIEGTGPVPSRVPIFGLPKEKDHHFLGCFPIAAYNKKTNELVMLRLEIDGRRKNMQIVWLEPN
ncbi:MAG: hypothetical protein IT250_03225 [Chitinophagaceae bacterium]|nr:hypothetical protein [Chitinophagaceae bacterium]